MTLAARSAPAAAGARAEHARQNNARSAARAALPPHPPRAAACAPARRPRPGRRCRSGRGRRGARRRPSPPPRTRPSPPPRRRRWTGAVEQAAAAAWTRRARLLRDSLRRFSKLTQNLSRLLGRVVEREALVEVGDEPTYGGGGGETHGDAKGADRRAGLLFAAFPTSRVTHRCTRRC